MSVSSNEQPLVSIAMCTYNGEKFLRPQLDSLIDQDYQNLEIIIVDDGSQDRSIEIINEYCAQHKHIRFTQNTNNLGFKANFAKAIELCRGDFIALCDQDDIWFPHKISTLVDEIGDNMLIYSKVSMIDEHGNPLNREFPANKNRVQGRCNLSFLFTNCVTGHACLFRKELVKYALPIPEGMDYHDRWLAFVASSIGTIKASHSTLSSYREHCNNAVLSRKHRIKKTQSKILQLIRKLKKEQQLLSVMAASTFLAEGDKKIIVEIQKKHSGNIWLPFNIGLLRAIKQHPEILAQYTNPEKNLYKICKGALLRWIS